MDPLIFELSYGFFLQYFTINFDYEETGKR